MLNHSSTEIKNIVRSDFLRLLINRIFIDSILLHRLFYCHRLPERSFCLKGRQFHICSRCTGILTGVLLVPFSYFLISLNTFTLVLIALITLMDGSLQAISRYNSNNSRRFFTGLTLLPSLLAISIKLFLNI